MVLTADFQDHVGDAGGIILADDMAAVDLHVDMHAVVDQQDRARRCGVALIAGELRLVLQRGRVAALQLGRELAVVDAVGGDIAVAAGGERCG